MSEAVYFTKFKCSLCGQIYDTEADADKCESRPVSQDRGVKVGDVVTITGGDGKGHDLEVTNVSVLSADWGHYARDRYWHTVAVTGKVLGDWGHRFCMFDNYEVKP